MSVQLDPGVAAKIAAFGRRRRKLIIVRGVYELIAILLCALAVVAWIDYAMFLEDATRYTLSMISYGVVAVVLWFTTLRKLFQRTDATDLARLFEVTRPELHEELLSAVELGRTPDTPQWDSEEFRLLVQRGIAQRVAPLTVEALLPPKLIRRWLYPAAAAVALTAALLFVPGLRYGRLLIRAALPTVNVARVSRTQIDIIAPTPAATTVPQGDPVQVIVQVSGRQVDTAFIESFEAGESAGRLRMQAIGEDRFSASLQIGRASVQYRVRAGDAMTKRFMLEAKARPHVVRFQKAITYPEYTGLAPKVLAEPHGGIAALEGSSVRLELTVDQPVSSGALDLSLAGEDSSLALESLGPDRLVATLPITRSGTYKIHLVAAETSFENRFSPLYEIQALADLVPSVTITQPEGDRTVTPGDVLPLDVHASDDLAVVSLARVVRINSGGWTDTPLTNVQDSAQVDYRGNWDLFALGAKPGDVIAAKFVARDLKGNVGESIVLRLTVSSPGFDPARLNGVTAKTALDRAVERLQESLGQLEETRKAALSDANPWDENRPRQEALRLATAAERVREQVNETADQLRRTLRAAHDDPAAADLALIGRALSRLENARVARAQDELAAVMDRQDPAAARAALEHAAQTLQQAATEGEQIARLTDRLVAEAHADVAQEDLDNLMAEQGRIDDAAAKTEGAEAAANLERRQHVAMDHARDVASRLGELADNAPEAARDRARALQQELSRQLDGVAQALDAHQPSREQMRAAVASSQNEMAQLARELRPETDEVRKAFAREVGPVADVLAELRQDLKPATPAAEATPPKAEPSKHHWAAAAAQLEDAADLEELRRGDPAFVRDVDRAARALDALEAESHEPEQQPAVQEKVKDLEAALRTLEMGHELEQTAEDLHALSARERWEADAPREALAAAREWNRLDDRMQQSEERLKAAAVPEPVRQGVHDAVQGPDAAHTRQEMETRAAQGSRSEDLEAPLDRMGDQFDQAAAQLRPEVDEARELLAKAAPTLAERLAKLAQEAGKLSGKTAELMTPHASAEPHAADHAREALNAQEHMNDKLDDARAALRRDANAQDLARPEGRARARDADDAQAMLRQPPPKAEDWLRNALVAKEPPARADALSRAHEQQEKLADTLDLLADHYRNLEEGRPEQTRARLREAEEELALRAALDEQYAMAERLARMAKETPDARLAALENELAANEAMRDALAKMSKDMLDTATEAMTEVAHKENALARQVEEQAQHESAAHKALSQRAQELANRVQKLAGEEVPKAAAASPHPHADQQQHMQNAGEKLAQAAQQVPHEIRMDDPHAGTHLQESASKMSQAKEALEAAAHAQAKHAQAKAGEAHAASEHMAAAQKQAQQANAAAAAAQQQLAQANETGSSPEAIQAHENAAHQAAEGARKAAQAAQQAQAAHAAAAKAAAQTGGKAAHDQMQQAAQNSAAAAQEAAAIADELAKQQHAGQSALTEASHHQENATAQAAHTGGQIARAGRHEARLGREAGSPLQQLGARTQATAADEMQQASEALGSQAHAAQAREPMGAAAGAVQQRLGELEALRKHGPPQGTSRGTHPSDAVAQWLARAVDDLDRALQGSPAAPPSLPGRPTPPQGTSASQQPPPSAAQSALAQASRSQAQSMRDARAASRVPGERGGPTAGAGAAFNSPPELATLDSVAPDVPTEDWGKLPRKVARDLMEARREEVPGEYRALVDAYFQAIAGKAQKNGGLE